MGFKNEKVYVSDVAYSDSDGSYQDLSSSIVLTSQHSGSDLPLHASIIRNGGSATTDFNASSQTVKVTPGIIRGFGTQFPTLGKKYVSTGGLQLDQSVLTSISGPYPWGSLDSISSSIAISNAYNKIRAYQEPFRGQQFMAELSQTLMLLKNPLKTYVGLLKDLRNNRSAKRSAENSWLEFQYGVLPLVSDIRAISDLVNDLNQQRHHETFKAYGVATDSSSRSFQNGTGIRPSAVIAEEVVRKSENFIRVGMTREYLDMLDTSNRFVDSFDTLSSLPITAWELVPYSFLVDYFVNVNGLLNSALTTQAGVSYVSNSTVHTVSVRHTIVGLSEWPEPDYFQFSVISPKSIVYTYRSVSRNGILAAIPPLVFTLPRSPVRFANMAALFSKTFL